ncbi:hypothetical protein BD410DRAFT_902822 [Rickenella mellea]|uniref:F-box domain-containing protein n=1 Tax=Rickenella mellea TaxID=50990 RepID=A0A4Y7PIY7_9AGAM|nr:hypothetical protein BD410DRAFT_902822 [Rickenella mellea]
MAGVPLDYKLTVVFHNCSALRALHILVVPERECGLRNFFKNMAPLETLQITGPFDIDLNDLKNLLQCILPTLKNLRISGDVDFDMEVAPLTFPRLECLVIQYTRFTTPVLKAFLERHAESLLETNILLSNHAAWIACLSFVTRIMRGFPILDDTGDESHPEDVEWGDIMVHEFAYAVQDVQSSQNRMDRVVTELGLAFSDVTWVDVDSGETLPPETLSQILPFIDHFPHLQVLLLSSERGTGGFFSEFMIHIGRHLSHLRQLKRLALAWDVAQKHWARDYYRKLPRQIYCAEGLESDQDSDDDTPPPVDIPPYCWLRDGSLDDYRWRVWEAQNYRIAECIFRTFFNDCPSVDVVEWYPFQPWYADSQTCWIWRAVDSRQLPGKEPSRFVVGDLSWKGKAVRPKTFHVAVGREAAYNTRRGSPF